MASITACAHRMRAGPPAVGGRLAFARAQPLALAGLLLNGSGNTQRLMHGSRLLAPPLPLALRRPQPRRSAAAAPPRAGLYSLPVSGEGVTLKQCWFGLHAETLP